MANLYHDQLSGSDLHENKVYPETGVELKLASLIALDARWSGVAHTHPQYNYKTQYVISASGSTIGDYIGNGTSDQTAFQSAHNAIPAAGGRITVMPGTYNWTGKLSISKSNVEIEFMPGAIIKAAAGAANLSLAFGQPGLIHIYNGSVGGTQSNVYIHGGAIDANKIADVNHVSVWGAGTDVTAWTTSRIVFENVRFLNKGNSTVTFGMFNMASAKVGSGTPSAGRINDIAIRRCVFDTGDKDMLSWYGDYFNDIAIEDCVFKSNVHHTIVQHNYISGPTTNRVHVNRNRFLNTKTYTGIGTRADFHDASRTGGYDLELNDNYFSNHGDALANLVDHMAINFHGWERWHINRNTFYDMWEVVSFGQSYAGNNWAFDGNSTGEFCNNIIEKVHSVFDNDSSYIMKMNQNVFKDCGFNVFSAYAQHQYTEFHDNIIYNANAYVEDATAIALAGETLASLSEYSKAAIQIGGSNRLSIKRNKVIDDRQLSDPGNSLTTLSQVAGGSLGARTYYVRISYANVSGETLASTEKSISLSASNLAVVKPAAPEGEGSTYHNVSGIRTINIYIGTAPGSETLQASLDFPDYNLTVNGWTEPATGLVSGAALPVANTTHALTKYGIYSLSGGTYEAGLNGYEGNEFYGIAIPFASEAGQDTSPRWNNFLNDAPLPSSVSTKLTAGADITVDLATPTKPNASASTSGGTLATDTYYYVVTALNATGESVSSIETSVSVTGPTGSVSVSWSSVTGATSYRLYRSNGTDQSHRQALYFATTGTSYTDTGGSGTAGSPPAIATALINKVSSTGDSFITVGNIGIGTGLPQAKLHVFDPTVADLIPQMTANNSPSGVATASSEANSLNKAYMAFDNDSATKWTANTATGTLEYDFGAGIAKIIKQYTITGPIGGQTTYAPKTWTLEASNDHSAWTTLDTQTNAPTWGTTERRIYPVSNSTAYRYYRLNVSANQGGSFLSIVEMELQITGTDLLKADAAGSTIGTPLQVAGPVATAVGTKTSAYTLTATDSVIIADATSAGFTVTLPTAVGITGRQYTVKRTNSGSNNITIACSNAQTIDGASTKTLGAQYSAVTMVSDGTNWQIVNVVGTVS